MSIITNAQPYWQIAVNAPLIDPLVYSNLNHLPIKPGTLVEVPLGRRLALGVCLKTISQPTIAKEQVKPILNNVQTKLEFLRSKSRRISS